VQSGRAVPVLIVLVLFGQAALIEAFRLSSLSTLSSADVWWHLSTGLWMVQNRALPHSGLHSQMSEFPWMASNWAYDLLLALGYRLLDLRIIPALLMCFKAALAVLTFLLGGGMRGSFWVAVALSAVSQYILVNVAPGPIYCSVLLFALELLFLVRIRRAGEVRLVWSLPLLFVVWANLDVRFAYGIALLLLLAGTALIARSNWPSLPPKLLGLVTGLCVAATVVTPYFYHPWGVFLRSVTSGANRYFLEFRAMSFHQPQDYALLLVTMVAFLSLGLRRSRDPFLIAMLVPCAILSFHSQRDAWVVTLAAVVTIGHATLGWSKTAEAGGERTSHRQPVLVAVALCVAVLLLAFELRIPKSRDGLLARVAASYPVAACDFIRAHHLPPPLFNAYEWGGFVTWYLPEYPVAVDGRTDLYGEDFLIQYSKVMNADVPYRELSVLSQAGTVLLPQTSLMAQAFSSVPAFQVAYRDSVAIVLVASESRG